jgi:hypothetical protein
MSDWKKVSQHRPPLNVLLKTRRVSSQDGTRGMALLKRTSQGWRFRDGSQATVPTEWREIIHVILDNDYWMQFHSPAEQAAVLAEKRDE